MSNIHEEEKLGKAYDARLMRRLMQYLRPYKWRVVLALALVAVVTPLELAPPWLFWKAIDGYFTPTLKHLIPETQAWRGIEWISLVFLLVLISDFLAQYAQIRIMQRVGQQTMYDMRREIFAYIQRMPMSYFDRNPVGRLVTRVTTDVDALNDLFAAGVVTMINDFFLLAVMAALLFYRGPAPGARRLRRAAVHFRGHLFLPQVRARCQPPHPHRHRAHQRFSAGIHFRHERGADIQSRAQSPRRIRESQSRQHAGLARRHPRLRALLSRRRISQHRHDHFDLLVRRQPRALQRPQPRRAHRLHDVRHALFPSHSGPQRKIQHPAIRHGRFRTHLQTAGRAHHHRFRRAVRAPRFSARRNRIPQRLVQLPRCARTADEDWVLRDVSFRVEPGQTLAIVGHTGAGKTTLISLLLRFYDVQRGQILLDGIDIRTINIQNLRRLFGIVLQDSFLFTGTIESNVRLGSPGIDRATVENAVDEIGLGDFIRSLPEGVDTSVNERGSTLSVGQRQLICFARALAHNPRFLILDEATSSVDTKTELQIREALDRLLSGRTSLVIAHRLSTIQYASRILVFHKGRLREQGAHQELLAQRGIYYRLYQLQYKEQELGLPEDSRDSAGQIADSPRGPLPTPQPATD